MSVVSGYFYFYASTWKYAFWGLAGLRLILIFWCVYIPVAFQSLSDYTDNCHIDPFTDAWILASSTGPVEIVRDWFVPCCPLCKQHVMKAWPIWDDKYTRWIFLGLCTASQRPERPIQYRWPILKFICPFGSIHRVLCDLFCRSVSSCESSWVPSRQEQHAVQDPKKDGHTMQCQTLLLLDQADQPDTMCWSLNF